MIDIQDKLMLRKSNQKVSMYVFVVLGSLREGQRTGIFGAIYD